MQQSGNSIQNYIPGIDNINVLKNKHNVICEMKQREDYNGSNFRTEIYKILSLL